MDVGLVQVLNGWGGQVVGSGGWVDGWLVSQEFGHG